MGGLLGGGEPGGPAGGPEDLRAIIAKAGRRMRIRAGAIAGAVAVVAGGGVGYAVSTTGGSTPQVIATSQGAGDRTSSAAPGAAQLSGPTALNAFPEASKFSRLFTRQANGVDIRAFVVSFPAIQPLSPASGVAAPTCVTTSRLQAELSTPGMVAVAGGGGFVAQQAAAIVDLQPAIVGQAEGDPVAVVVVMTGPTVAKVRMSFNGGATDEMAPRGGWSVLTAPASWFQPGKSATTIQLGTLTVLDSGGRAVESRALNLPPAPAPVVVQGSAGTGSAGSGTVSSGAAGASGSTGTASGKATSPPIAYPCQVPPACTGYPNGISCPAPLPMPAVTAPSKPPSSSSATTPAAGAGR